MVLNPDDAFEDVELLDGSAACAGLDGRVDARKFAQSRHVLLELVVEAAFQAAALSAEPGRIQREVLQPGGVRRYRFELLQPGRAAQLPPARTHNARSEEHTSELQS